MLASMAIVTCDFAVGSSLHVRVRVITRLHVGDIIHGMKDDWTVNRYTQPLPHSTLSAVMPLLVQVTSVGMSDYIAVMPIITNHNRYCQSAQAAVNIPLTGYTAAKRVHGNT